ncbi:protein XcpP [Pseudomonas sp. NPDC088368]|jgi:type II secretory pathway component PulC|uniref:protein XcpP n=1 Tax=Pseudomonas sp. NPDC088368 TaxID=3364453 RepID=UPI0037F449B9
MKSLVRSHGISCLFFAAIIGYGYYLVLSEKQIRATLAVTPVAVNADPPSHAAMNPINTHALLTSMGFLTSDKPRQSTESAIVKGIFMASDGTSVVLLSVAGRAQRYRLGDRLPGGSVLRKVESGRVLLSNNGLETFLPLSANYPRTLVTTGAPSSVPMHLKPQTAMPPTR